MAHPASTVDPEEIERFSRIADEWWDPHGKFAPLHAINPVRLEWIKGQIERHFGKSAMNTGGQQAASALSRVPCEGQMARSGDILKLLDIGCGGGLICEPMARLGFATTGIDASEKNIRVAQLHAEQHGIKIDYRCTAAEAMQQQFDIVLALEIVEHVADVPAFVAATCNLVKPGGLIIYSTLNRTLKSYALAIVGAEYVLRWLPRGTHTWKKFLKPSELARELRANNIDVTEMTGLVMNPLTFKWGLNPRDLEVNYLVAGKKNY